MSLFFWKNDNTSYKGEAGLHILQTFGEAGGRELTAEAVQDKPVKGMRSAKSRIMRISHQSENRVPCSRMFGIPKLL